MKNTMFLHWFTVGSGINLLISLVSIVLFIWLIYDTLVLQKKMNPIEKLFWIILAFFVPIIIPIVYYYVVIKNQRQVFDGCSGFPIFSKDLDEIEKLYELKKEGAITEEEYNQKKKQLLEK